jgi:hypothetical protein
MALVSSNGLPPATGSACTMPVCIDFSFLLSPLYLYHIPFVNSLLVPSLISILLILVLLVHLLEMSNFEELTTMSNLK